MKRMKSIPKYIVILFTAILYTNLTFSQSKEKVDDKLTEAVKLMDSGKVDESIELLKTLRASDPENIDYAYEMAFAYYLKEDYQQAVDIFEASKNYKNNFYAFYSLWGSAYDMMGQPDKAIEIYDLGIKDFPNSGNLYREKGIVYEKLKDYNNAVEEYKKGIRAQPMYPSNYYNISIIYLNSNNKVPGLIYGELFLNIERNTDRARDMSKLLFEAYKNAVVFENNHWIKTDFTRELFLDPAKFEKDKKLPWSEIFHNLFLIYLELNDPPEINLNSLSNIRQGFIINYCENYINDYQNVLLDYQKTMMENNVFNAYNHYVFQMGAPEEYAEWVKNNPKENEEFFNWYLKTVNYLKVNKDNYFEFEY